MLGVIVRKPLTHTFYGFQWQSKLSREDCFLSVLVHLCKNVCIHSSGTFTEKEAMSEEASNIHAHTELFPHSQVNSAGVYWDYS